MVEDSASLIDFYDRAYLMEGAQAAVYARWRSLGAVGKAEHVIALCEGAEMTPRSTLDVGCGDGALLGELRRRGFGGRLEGAEISESALAIATARADVDAVTLFDGEKLPFGTAEFDLGVISHVLEHVPDPARLLGEVARVCGAVVFEVPLEANLSARRAGKSEHAMEIGHLHRLDRGAARAIATGAGLRVGGELEDALPLEVQRFFARSGFQRALATGKWAARASAHRLAPALARRMFTVHYACLCLQREL